MFKKKRKHMDQKTARQLITVASPKSIISEQFRTIRTNLTFSLPDEELKTLFFTSASALEGKSTISANTAVTFAQAGKKVLFVDADMRKPTVHYTFRLPNAAGLSTVLTKQITLEEVIRETDIDNLSVITSGPIPPNPSELLGSKTMTSLLEKLKEDFDLIVFDAPPTLSVTDAQILSNEMDGTVLVIDVGYTEKDSIIKAKELLEQADAKILGVVLNNYTNSSGEYYEYYG
ncbi:CpsD/CapB family tyrosine-protein kinase [Pseudogracilibacillus sp. ICA-222130]|uniref:CpsD/CapB family tyrosine-protein kinase n=1 Tax=Pseudogracilibacillus sp. ICA-222130 TaxID=3134655 RepID=UPI0030C39913